MLHAKIHQIFLVGSFALHYCFIVLIIGTPVLALWQHLRKRDGAAWQMLRSYYPVIVSLTITTGVAPFLFAQTLHHRHFYRAFINLYPLPLIGLVMLIAFFYLAYAVVNSSRWLTPILIVQILMLACFALFFGALYNGLIYPEHHQEQFWLGERPPWLWHSTAAHLVVATGAAAIFYGLRSRSWWLRGGVLFGIGAIVAVIRAVIRTKVLGDGFPKPIIEEVDPSIVVFLLGLVLMIWVLYKAIRLAIVEDAPPAPD